MKKSFLLSALLAGFVAASGAQAHSSVTLYGVVDAGIGGSVTKWKAAGSKVKSSKIGFKGGNLSGNRWGLKGVEDLGNGNHVVFNVESGFSIENGKSGQGNTLFGRKAMVGLSGDWGTLGLGRQYNMADTFVSGFDLGSYVLDANPAGDATGSRMNSSVSYLTPDLGGFQAGVAFSGEKQKVDGVKSKSEKHVSVGASYKLDGVGSFGAAYDRFKKDASFAAHIWSVGASADVGFGELAVAYGQQRNGYRGDVAGVEVASYQKGLRSHFWTVGLQGQLSDSTSLVGSYRGGKVKVVSNKVKTNQVSLALTESLSKRTTAYAVASYSKSKVSGAKVGTASEVGAALGLRHKF